MEVLKRLNKAVEYMETNLLCDIDYERVAKEAHCSSYNFHRMFSFITDITPMEYVRRRRLTLAALELQETKAKIIDIALEYGYESPVSFARAFNAIHGVSPSFARDNAVNLKAYPRISFQIQINGESEMNYRIEKKGSFKVYGVEVLISAAEDPKHFKKPSELWQKMFDDGTYEKLLDSTSYEQTPGFTDMCRLHAVMNYKSTPEGTWPYMICAVAAPESDTKGFDIVDIPAHTWAVFPSKKYFEWDKIGSVLNGLNKRIYAEWLPTTEYEKAEGPEFEMYGGTETQGYIELWIPVKKK